MLDARLNLCLRLTISFRKGERRPHRDFLLAAIDTAPDLTISELLARLLEERGMKASRSTLWTFLDRCGLTFKKRQPTRASKTDRTS